MKIKECCLIPQPGRASKSFFDGCGMLFGGINCFFLFYFEILIYHLRFD